VRLDVRACASVGPAETRVRERLAIPVIFDGGIGVRQRGQDANRLFVDRKKGTEQISEEEEE